MRIAASWSGGKDSCFACYKAIEQGYKVDYLLNFISKEYKRCAFHGIPAKLIELQAESIGIPLSQKEVTADMKEYEKEFKEAIIALRDKGIEGIVFGDIYLDEHKEWVERVCKEVNVTAIEPLWNIPIEDIINDFINSGFKAVVVSCQANLFDKNFVGKEINKVFLEELKLKKICPCGENGEFHTLVIDGPIFKNKIEITKSEAVLKEGFWKYWFLDIQEYKLGGKHGMPIRS